MSPFAIFVIVLTLAYIIYYGVMISRDLTMKPSVEESNVEAIEVDEFAPVEKPETVKSVGDGFQVGEGPVYQPEPEPAVISLDASGNIKEESELPPMSSALAQRFGEAIEEMEDVDVDSQPELTSDDYSKMMASKHGISINDAL